MLLDYSNKKSEKEIIQSIQPSDVVSVFGESKNKLFYGDNLPILKYLLKEYAGKIDLIYIDPPFATNTEFRIGVGRTSTISSSISDELAYSDTKVGYEFIEFLRERLIFLRELLSDQGSIYLHIDYKIGHYVKIIMDEIFGISNFRNDITRIKCNPKNFSRKAYGNIKDMILFYSKTNNYIRNDPKELIKKNDIEKRFSKIDHDGRRYTTIPLHAPGETDNGDTGKPRKGILPPQGRHWRTNPIILEKWDADGLIEWSKNGVPRKKIFADENQGKKRQDIWDFKDPQYPVYPTEKNNDMLKSIILASSSPSSLILDCFCGSGGTLVCANELGRNFIGVDQSIHAIKTTINRLKKQPTLFDCSSNVELLFDDKYINQKEIVMGYVVDVTEQAKLLIKKDLGTKSIIKK